MSKKATCTRPGAHNLNNCNKTSCEWWFQAQNYNLGALVRVQLENLLTNPLCIRPGSMPAGSSLNSRLLCARFPCLPFQLPAAPIIAHFRFCSSQPDLQAGSTDSPGPSVRPPAKQPTTFLSHELGNPSGQDLHVPGSYRKRVISGRSPALRQREAPANLVSHPSESSGNLYGLFPIISVNPVFLYSLMFRDRSFALSCVFLILVLCLTWFLIWI